MREGGYGGAGGKIIEGELLGNLTLDKKLPYNERLNPLYRKMDLNGALDYARNAQVGDPFNPDRRFARKMRQILGELLKIKDQSQLKFYCSIDSPADWQGIDGFIDYHPFPDKPEVVITLTMDVTTYDKGNNNVDVMIIAERGGYDYQDPDDKEKLEELAQNTAQNLYVAAILKREQLEERFRQALDKN